MSMFIVQSRTVADRVGLAFDSEGASFVALSLSDDTPNVVIQAFDPARDVFYNTPSQPTPQELEVELRIHFPESLTGKLDGRPIASTIGSSILMQVVKGRMPAISPLPAIRIILESIGSVNSAILQADNGGLLFVRRAGDDYSACVSEHTISTFVNLTHEEREALFPDFSAQEVILSGEDVGALDADLSDPLLLMRKIGIQDLLSLIDLSEDVFESINSAPHRFTLAIGAAAIDAEIRCTVVA